MTGTFSSFGTALSALHYNRVLMDVASSNVANSGTAGYVRRRADGEAVGAPAQVAMWSQSTYGGEGVKVGSLERMSDEFLESRSRFEHGNNSYLAATYEVLGRFETTIGEPGQNGVSAALNDFRAGWHDLAVSPDGLAARSQVMDRANTLVEAIQIQARNVSQEESDQRSRLESFVSEVNVLAGDLADTNRSIGVATFTGADANLLLDQRNVLAARLAELTGAVATQRADGGYDVTVNGTSLVSGQNAGVLAIATGAAGGAVSFTIDSAAVPTGMKGEVGATADLLTTTLPAYRQGLGDVARQLADLVNAQHAAGFDEAGNPGGAFFAFDPADPSGTLRVALADSSAIAASGVPGGGRDGSNATLLANTAPVEDAYQRLVNQMGSQVASAKRLAGNQAAITTQVDNSREQLAGVSIDEEMVSLVAAQRGYEAASRVMTTLDQMLDTLINRTGLVGR